MRPFIIEPSPTPSAADLNGAIIAEEVRANGKRLFHKGDMITPENLDSLGLVAALEWQANEFHSRTGIPCHVVAAVDDSQLQQQFATVFFRIYQETLTNIIRHAGATRVDVRLAEESGALVLTVQDNGRGISEDEIANTRSIGLVGMRERFAFVLNQCPAGRGTRASEAARGLSEFGVLADPPLGLRADHQDAMASGLGVTEYAAKGKAAEEIRTLWSWVDHKMTASKPSRKGLHA